MSCNYEVSQLMGNRKCTAKITNVVASSLASSSRPLANLSSTEIYRKTADVQYNFQIFRPQTQEQTWLHRSYIALLILHMTYLNMFSENAMLFVEIPNTFSFRSWLADVSSFFTTFYLPLDLYITPAFYIVIPNLFHTWSSLGSFSIYVFLYYCLGAHRVSLNVPRVPLFVLQWFPQIFLLLLTVSRSSLLPYQSTDFYHAVVASTSNELSLLTCHNRVQVSEPCEATLQTYAFKCLLLIFRTTTVSD